MVEGSQFIPLQEVKRLRYGLSSYEHQADQEMGRELVAKGLMTGAGVVQGDIAAATSMRNPDSHIGSDKPLCDTNCGIEGGYACPARRLANLGLTTKGLAPADKLMQAFLTGAEGIKIFNRKFIEDGSLDRYCEAYNIPSDVRAGIINNLLHEKILANIFGGNAEMHPDALMIARGLHEAGLQTTLTTTCGILLSDSPKGKAFLDGLQKGYVDVLAVTGEFKSAEDVKKLSEMSLSELKKERKTIPFEQGQLRKGVAAVFAGKLQNELPNFPQVLFNIVVHPGNLEHIEEILASLREAFPNATLNPYPAQSSFDDESPIFLPEQTQALKEFVDNRLTEQQGQDPHMVLRPHYYAMLAAALTSDPLTASRMLSGYDVWKCYAAPYDINGAGRVVQFGASPELRDIREIPDAGGSLACFWNDTTITRRGEKVWNMQGNHVANHIDGGMQEIARQTDNPCSGCIMPRLTGDMLSQELGMNPNLRINYLKQRASLVGF